MTRATAIASILKKLGDAHYQAADELLALASTDEPAAGTAGVRPVAATPSAAPTSFSDGIPVEEPPVWQDEIPADMDIPQGDVLSECPDHQRRWTVREGGISKNGKPYKAFWKCSGKNADGSYCNKKPLPAWVKTHDPEKALAAAAA